MRLPEKSDIQSLLDPTMPLEWYVDMKEQLGLRCDYIVRNVAETLGVKVEWWDFDNSPSDLDDGTGEFDPNMYVSAFGIIGEFKLDGERVTLLRGAKDLSALSENSIPVEWIWMSDDEWQAEAEILMSVGSTTDGVQQQKEGITRGIHDRHRKMMREAIMAKLTQEELKHIIFK